MIGKTIKNIRKNTLILWRGYLQQKYQQQKKILYKVLEGILTAKITNTKKFFLPFIYIKGVRYKTWI